MDFNFYDQAFPFNFRLSPDRFLTRLGPSLAKLCQTDAPRRPFSSLFDVDEVSGLNLDSDLNQWCGTTVSLRLLNPSVRMTGSFLNLGPDQGLIFVGTLGPEHVDRLASLGLTENDFAPHDLCLDQARSLALTKKRVRETEKARADLRETRQLQEALHRKAHTDPLTQVANRSAFVEALKHAVSAPESSQTQLAVMIVDIDRFKSINDFHGHLAGDETLRAVAGHLTAAVGEQGLVARLGGDEFGILIPALPIEQDLTRTIDRIVAIKGKSFRVDTATVEVNITLGVVIRRREKTGNDLLRHADIAMYEARRTHQQPVCIFNPTARRNLDIRKAIRQELPEALESNQVDLVYQPEVDLATGLPTRLEAFVRWHHPEFGLLDTRMFIEEVDRCQMSRLFHRYVLRRATTDALSHFQTDSGPMALSVNLSPLSIANTLAADVDQVLGLTGFPANKLVLEVTEVGGDQEMQRTAAILHDLAAIGVTIAIDDFGTGHSSLKNLSQLPIGALKMDGSFTSSVSSSRKALELVRATIRICQMLELSLVAEGVESAEHAHLFNVMGFEYGQGYYFGRPGTVEETARLMNRRLPLERRRSTDHKRQPRLEAGLLASVNQDG